MRSLKVKAGIASLLATAGVLATVGIIITLTVERDLRATLGAQIERITAVNAVEIDENARVLQEMLGELARRVPLQRLGNASALEAFIRADGALFSLVDAVVIYRRDGSVAADWPPDAERRSTNYAFRDWFQETIRTREPVVSRPFAGRNSRTPRVVFTVPVLDPAGELAAVVTGTVLADRKNLLGHHLSSGIGSTGFFVLVDPGGTIIHHPDRNRILEVTESAGMQAMQRLRDGRAGHFEGTNREGMKRIVAASRLPRTAWTLIGAMPVEEAFAPLAGIRSRIVVLSAVLLLCLLPLAWLFLGRLLRPLFLLRNAVEAMRTEPARGLALDDRARSHVEVRVVAEAIDALVRDIAAGHRELARNEAQYRRIVETAQEGVWMIDRDGRTVFTNPRMAQMLGYEAKDMHGKSLFEFMDEEAIADAQTKLERRRQGISEQHDFRLRHKSGEAVWALMSTNPVLDEDGRYQGALAMVSDISARKRAEQAVATLNAELEQRVRERTAALESANKELETFTYSVSHDLKAPLRAIDGYCQLLLSDYAGRLDEEGAKFLHNVRKSAQAMGELINDLLEYSRLERSALELVSVDSRELIESVLEEYAQDIKARSVAVTVPANLVAVRADRASLSAALRNLIDNALKFSRDRTPPEIEFGCSEGAMSHDLWVRDNGEGFDMKYVDRIFGIFQRLNRHEEYPGTGVGLAIVRKAMDRIGGRAWAESAPGKGATFHLEIPK